jgi:hypothetical protein
LAVDVKHSFSRSRPVVALTLLLAAATVFILRGPYRELRDSADFATVYSASRCWMAGLSPYQQANIDREYRESGGDPIAAPNSGWTASVYPPSTLALVSILAATDWTTAKVVWMMISTVSFLASLVLIVRSAYARSHKLVFYLLAFGLLFSPVHAGLAKGQPSVLAISLLTAAIYLPVFPRRELLAGLLVGLSCCLKPQIALPFMLFLAWQRRWSLVTRSLCVVILVWAVALPRIAYRSPTWASDWAKTMQASSKPGSNSDPTFGPSSPLLVNFQAVVGFFTDKRVIYNLVTYAMIAGLAILVFVLKHPQPQLSWLMLGLFSVLILLASYHRYYDLQLLLLGASGIVTLDWTFRRHLLALILSLVGCLSLPLQAAAARAYSMPALANTLARGGRALAFVALHHQPLCLAAIALAFARLIVVVPSERYSAWSSAQSATHVNP